MHCLQIELIVCLDGNKAHVLPCHGFGNGFGIEKVVFIGLEKVLQTELESTAPHDLGCAVRSDKVRTRTGFEADQCRLQFAV